MSPKAVARRSRRKTIPTTTRATRKQPAKPARPTRSTRRAASATPAAEPEPETPLAAPVVEAVAPSPPPADPPPLPEELAPTAPELDYAARAAPPEPERPWPGGRRAVFFDVENTSHAPHVERTLRHLGLDRRLTRTDFMAVGNWRVIGLDIARLLSRAGAQLVHSAPATGVRDWSDLRIAVSAGVWLGVARPGDRIEIVSDDRAFDAVGDVAAALGVEFHRLSHRALSGAPPAPAPAAPGPSSTSSGSSSSRYRGRRRRPYGRSGPAPSHSAVPAPPPPVAALPSPPVSAPSEPYDTPPAATPEGEVHTAPHDEIIDVVRELVAAAHGRPILIDTLARELKRRGFGRTPGSPRLVTRLRRIRELSVSPTGMIALVGGVHGHAAPAPMPPPPSPVPDVELEPEPIPSGEELVELVVDAPAPAAAPASGSGRSRSRRRRRGGRRRTSPA